MPEYKQFRIIDVFNVKNTYSILSRDINDNSGLIPYLTASQLNNAVGSYVDYDDKLLDKGNCIFIGGKTFVVTYQEKDFFSNDSHNLALYLKKEDKRTRENYLFMVAAIYKSLYSKYSWGNSISYKKIQRESILLPVTIDGEINFMYMENHIRELELVRIRDLEQARIRELDAYLKVTGFTDYRLTDVEERFLAEYRAGTASYKVFRLDELFEHIVQGRRLKKEDHIAGSFPFVMSGITNTGLVAYIDNPINHFPANSITVDIFGNVFYRSYEYSASDDVGVYWSDKALSREALLFITSAIQKQLNGKFNFSKKLRASQNYGLEVKLPVDNNGNPDYDYMTAFIRIQQKRAIKNTVEWKDKVLGAYKAVVVT